MQSFEARGTFSADEVSVAVGCSGFGGVAVQIAAGLTGTVTFEGSADGTNYEAMIMTPIGTTVGVTTTTTAGLWRGCCVGLVSVRARCSTYSSGTASVTVKLSEASPTLNNLT